MKVSCLFGIAAAVVAGMAAVAWGEDVYLSIPLEKVTLTSGKLPAAAQGDPGSRIRRGAARRVDEDGAMRPTAHLDGNGGEAYVTVDFQNFNGYSPRPLEGAMLRVRLVNGAPATGRMVLPRSDGSGMDVVTFKVRAENGVKEENKEPKEQFFTAKADYYESLVARRVAGTAYFRHLAAQAEDSLPEVDRNVLLGRREIGSIEDAYSMFTGGRAVAESLQLERVFLSEPKGRERTVDINTLEGITVKPFDWTEKTRDLKNVELDPLASLVPHDQHAIFFPSFQALSTLMDEADTGAMPVLQNTEPRSEDALTKERYQKQLGLDMSALGKLLGPAVIKSIAITGSDPYLRMGSDIAVLFEPSGDVETLRVLLMMQIVKNTSGEAKTKSGKASGEFNYSFVRSPDRAVCSNVAVFGNFVVVSNSETQLAAIHRAFKKPAEALASLPEYVFFRNRYPRADKDETAFLILTDATIRRWCSPKVRIADARRVQAAAILADREAASLIAGPQKERVPGVEMGKMEVVGNCAQSSIYNTLDFMTPISELELDKVTADEAAQYARWRDSYQDYYRKYFDPIAMRFSVNKSRLAADVTVMPLIQGSMYKETLARITGDATFGPTAADPHAALLQLVLAIDPKGELLNLGGGMADFGLPNPLSWVGSSVSVYVEDDPIWAELAKSENVTAKLQEVYPRLPIALRIESRDAVKLALFASAAKRHIDKSAPNTVTFENITYGDYTYVKISSRGPGRNDAANLTVYYLTLPDSLLITVNEPLLKRAIDRTAKAAAAKTQPAASQPAKPAEWLGQSAALHIDRAAIDILMGLGHEQQLATLQSLAWSNIPILNELKRLHPDDDALVWYGKLFHGRLLEPTGGKYQWNKELQTYESTALGSPINPKTCPTTPAFLPGILSADLGLTFEADGLRARAQLLRKAPESKK